jgi:CubicO group peptidase (beta-lactamase class C family)
MDATRLVAVQRLLRERYPWRGPGAAILIVADDVPVMLAGFGRANVREEVPVTPGTLFDLASVSKHLTAYAVLLLVSRGKLSHTDEVRQHFPSLDAYRSGGRPLRISDLVFHSSGLPDYTCMLEEDEYPNFDNNRLVAWVAEQDAVFVPGTRGYFLKEEGATYCNTNYVLLASLVERISGQPFADFLKKEIFDPLGMKTTFSDPWEAQHPGQALRYDSSGRLISSPRIIPVQGDGNIYTTMTDYVRWDAELAHPTLLDPSWLAQLFVPGHLDDGQATDYAWGWYVRNWSGRRVAWHGGSWDGASTCIARWFEDGVRLALFSNTHQHKASEVLSEIEEILLD